MTATEPEQKTLSVLQWIKSMQYPAILAVFAAIIVGLFFFAARFLSMSINAALSSPDEMQIQAQLTHINMSDYEPVKEKLNLPAIGSIGTGAVEPPLPQEQAAQESLPTPAKSMFSIAVFNSTKQPGLANTLKGDLIAAGFTVAETGNKSPAEPTTIIRIKERVQASPAIIEEMILLIGKRFRVDDPQILENGSPYDIVITIGSSIAR
ncbi:hypothetical protein A2524_01305 [Candidatus Wolfebacteria bacterium RIFOXYD12_FULL_48_21]|uniref:LytR/CpsA/Psr regulator C-terminal domain-containing protein n=1 Tax=Candidatus Wolfebacteria bacterium RIFOXYD1_FULL_48_65 TaxID=1802561 RepID=A0A1F8DYW9_9BACT|nr:MAG: hypothetical protein A2610_00490 [Candidatus Wolfebacteria bacterium RIFOXYD1_FULL_48_65]OGM94445.1 MAG: hypothetical protein A2524_01305 [Candidatus Wolfebacteria bacterium RIFOXYD12_FULL_48_21]OGM97161.1 MAG: hypothetical protein A2532_01960 [Candidatus Wolfebacteria bacterium RIFOXYD2_FULL_48_11]